MEGAQNSQFETGTKLQFFDMKYSSSLSIRIVYPWEYGCTVHGIPMKRFTKITHYKIYRIPKAWVWVWQIILKKEKLLTKWKSNKNSQVTISFKKQAHVCTRAQSRNNQRFCFLLVLKNTGEVEFCELCKGQQILSCVFTLLYFHF